MSTTEASVTLLCAALPPIFNHLSKFMLWRQQVRDRNSDIPLRWDTLQLILGHSEVFPGMYNPSSGFRVFPRVLRTSLTASGDSFDVEKQWVNFKLFLGTSHSPMTETTVISRNWIHYFVLSVMIQYLKLWSISSIACFSLSSLIWDTKTSKPVCFWQTVIPSCDRVIRGVVQ